MRRFGKFGRIALCVLILAGSASCDRAGGKQVDYRKQSDLLYQAIKDNFHDEKQNLYYETTAGQKGLDENPYSYLWPLLALYQAYCERYRAEGKKDDGLLTEIGGSLAQYWDEARPPVPGYDSYVCRLGGGQRYYDDNEWVGLTDCDLYQATGDEQYLKKAEAVYDFVMTGADDALEGGIYWREGDGSTKNACSNAPAAVLALRLYQLTGKKDRDFLDTAQKLYGWTNRNLRSEENVYWDNIRTSDGTVDKTEYAYNTGMMIAADALFYAATQDKAYLGDGKELAEASLSAFAPGGKFPDDLWFNAVLLRGYRALYEQDHDKKYVQAFRKYADEEWKARGESGLFGKNTVKELKDQAAMLEICESLAQLEP